MMLVPCYLAPSAIEGLGVFCSRPIEKGEAVWHFDATLDQLIPLANLARYPDHIRTFIDRYSYTYVHDHDFVVLDADEGRFMNHADTPNLDFTDSEWGYALVDIPAGVELTCNYRCFTVGALEFQPPRHAVYLPGPSSLLHPAQ